MVVHELIALKQEFHWPYQRLCEAVGIAYPSFKRYRDRLARGQAVILAPGPKKTEPLKLPDLMAEIRVKPCAQTDTGQHGSGRPVRRERLSQRV
jgi:hypothetical protein